MYIKISNLELGGYTQSKKIDGQSLKQRNAIASKMNKYRRLAKLKMKMRHINTLSIHSKKKKT